MIEYINKNSDPKCTAVKNVGIKYQGKYFRPCIGLNYSIRWGRYCIDLRPLCHYLKITEFAVWARSQKLFESQFGEFVKKLPCDLFLSTVDNAISSYRDSKREKNLQATVIDDLPF